MSAPLDDQYLEWLYGQVAPVNNRSPSKRYWRLFKQLYSKEFVWIVPNDDNRVEDGRDLRYEFITETPNLDVDEAWMNLPCSMLELLIAIARILTFEADRDQDYWFWHLIKNLNLEQCTDARYSKAMEDYVDIVLNDVIWRTYSKDGSGGLFPLKRPNRDQRKIEIWYQLNAYLLENY